MGWRIPSLSKSYFLSNQQSHLTTVLHIHLAIATKPPQLIYNVISIIYIIQRLYICSVWCVCQLNNQEGRVVRIRTTWCRISRVLYILKSIVGKELVSKKRSTSWRNSISHKKLGSDINEKNIGKQTREETRFKLLQKYRKVGVGGKNKWKTKNHFVNFFVQLLSKKRKPFFSPLFIHLLCLTLSLIFLTSKLEFNSQMTDLWRKGILHFRTYP